jgi:hypothetical protein
MALFDPAIFDADAFDASAATPPPDGSTAAYMSDANPLFDGTLRITVGPLDVTSALLPGLSYSSTNPGGFGECTFRLPAQSPVWGYGPYNAWVAKGVDVVITHGSSAVTLFEGEITNDVSHAVIEDGFAYYDVNAAGLWWKAGLNGTFCRVWGDDDPGQWFEKNTSGGVFQVDTDGKLEIRFEAEQTAKSGASKSLYYWLDNGLGDPGDGIAAFVGEAVGYVSDKDTAQWHADISYSTSPWGTFTPFVSWDNETIAAGTPFIAGPFTAGTVRALRLRLYVDTAKSTGTTADRYISLSNFSVFTPTVTPGTTITSVSAANPSVCTTTAAHNLKTDDRIWIQMDAPTDTTPDVTGWQTITVTGPTTFTIPVNVTSGTTTDAWLAACARVDSAIADIADTTSLAATTSLQTGGIGNLNWGINVRPHMTRAEAIDMLAANYADPIDYGFWDDASFYCQERPASPPAENDYIIDTSAPGIDFDVFANAEDSPTHVKVLHLFRDVDGGTSIYPNGTLLAVYRPSAPTWADAGTVIDVWDEWADMSLTTAQANAIGDQILDWIAYNKYAGTITIATPTVPLRAGNTKLTSRIRAGDYIQDANATISRSMITSMSMDVDSGTATLGIGENRRDFVARISGPGRRGGWRPTRDRDRRPSTPFRHR